MTAAPKVVAAVAETHRREWAFVLAATVRLTADLDLAEECVQHAYAKAMTSWSTSAIPDRPGAWLTTVARRRAIDELRREATGRRLLPLLVEDSGDGAPDHVASSSWDDGRAHEGPVGDDRLRLIFTCCHPALSPAAQVALTLRLVCGLTTAEVARAFLVADAAMAARITRAKKKIAAARIPYRVPSIDELPARIDAVLDVVHLVLTTGHSAPIGAVLVRRDLLQRSIDLARMLKTLLPRHAEVTGLLALALLTSARVDARLDDAGRIVLLADQDRGRWNGAAIDEGLALVEDARMIDPDARFALMAAIAAVHAKAPSWDATDWSELVGLYTDLVARWPSPVVALNRAVAIGLADGPVAGLAALEPLLEEPQLAGYGYLASARADFLRRLGRTADARDAYEEAMLLTTNDVERDFLAHRIAELAG